MRNVRRHEGNCVSEIEAFQPLELDNLDSSGFLESCLCSSLIGYLALCSAIVSAKACLGFVPYLGLALLCTWFPKSMGQGRKAYTHESGSHYMGIRWGWTSPRLVMAGGWLLLLLPAIVGGVLRLMRKG